MKIFCSRHLIEIQKFHLTSFLDPTRKNCQKSKFDEIFQEKYFVLGRHFEFKNKLEITSIQVSNLVSSRGKREKSQFDLVHTSDLDFQKS